jgi:Flp pilus assembly protein TadB
LYFDVVFVGSIRKGPVIEDDFQGVTSAMFVGVDVDFGCLPISERVPVNQIFRLSIDPPVFATDMQIRR